MGEIAYPGPEDVVPFEDEDPELGDLVAWYCRARPLAERVIELGLPIFAVFLHPDFVEIYGNRGACRKVGPGFFYSKDTPRNSDCPCGSGKKYKKCCLQR